MERNLLLSKGLILATLFVASVSVVHSSKKPSDRCAFDRMDDVVLKHAKVDGWITDPRVYAQNVNEILANQRQRASLDFDVVKAMQTYMSLANLEKDFPESCSSESVESIEAFRAPIGTSKEDSTYAKMQQTFLFKMAAKLIKEHAERCQPVYYEHFEEELEEDERENAEELGKHIMQHLLKSDLVKGVCVNEDAGACLKSKPLGVINSIEALDDRQATKMVYRTLLDLARDDPNVSYLSRIEVASSEAPQERTKKRHKWKSSLTKCFKPSTSSESSSEASSKKPLSQQTKELIKNKLPHNQEFNRLYDNYIVSKCKFVVVDLGRHILKPMDYDRDYLRDQYKLSIKSDRFLYSWLAYSTCRSLVLNPDKLNSFPVVVANSRT